MNRIYHLILFLSVAGISPASDLQNAIDRARRHAGIHDYDFYKVILETHNRGVKESGFGDAWVLLDTSDFIDQRTRLVEVIPTLLMNTVLINVSTCPSNCNERHVFVTRDSVWSYNRNRNLIGRPPPLDIAYPISVMNDLLETENGRQYTRQELLRFATTIIQIEPTLQLMLNSWLDVYDEFPGIPYQSLFEFIDEVTPEVAKQLEADWLAFERFKDEAPMEVRSEISPPHSEIINDQISLTYYLLSRDYDVIKCIIIYRDKQFELSAVDSLGNYIEGYGD